jgi:DNA-binding response OmpR family regulator
VFSQQVLLVSRDNNVTVLRQKILEMAGYSVTAARYPAEAMAYLNTEKFDAVIIGYTVPPDEQRALCTQLRADHPEIPILAIYKVIAAADCGATRYIHSLDGPDAMLAALKEMLASLIKSTDGTPI